MRLCHFFIAVVAGQLLLHASADERVLAPTVVQTEPCTLVMREVQFKDGRTQSNWRCELSSNDASVAGTLFVDVDGLTDEDLKKVRSGITTVFAEGATITNGKLTLAASTKKEFGTAEPNSPSVLAAKQGNQASGVPGRSLTGDRIDTRLVLVVRVVGLDSQPTSTLPQIRNFTFGTTGDVSNLKERFLSCSYGATQIVPFDEATWTDVSVTRGAISLDLPMYVNGQFESVVVSEALFQLDITLGPLEYQFDHVMLVLPPGTISDEGDPSWNAWSYSRSYLSVYNNDASNYPAVQMRNIGKNMGLDLSGEGSDVSGDSTCVMGFKGYGLDTLNMCFNAAKSWQLGWYSSKRIALDFTQRTGFSGQLYGISNYKDAEGYVSIKILGSPFEQPDIYVGFNLATGINVDTQEAKNRVTVYSKWGGTAPSSLIGKLNAGQTLTLPSFDYDGNDLVIKAKTISTTSGPVYADVDIYLENCPPTSFTKECNSCSQDTDCLIPTSGDCTPVGATCVSNTCVYDTSTCQGYFSLKIKTDTNPYDVWWAITDLCTDELVFEGDSYFSFDPIKLRSAANLGQSRYRFTMWDNRGDGFSANYFIGSFEATFDDFRVAATSGDFGYEYSSYFGLSTCP